ncbi:MAG: extracellular solute-binding protein [Heliobacteriaceae bacterium]|jgi:putative chitobiose transport system substrate-binding protein|nr:extracellular solute-binding protein [Heliobacteriaceae bacterium]
MLKYLKILIAFIIILIGFLFISENKSDDKAVVFWTLQMNDFAPYINGVIAEFETQYPGTKIKWIDIPFSEGEKRTLASILSKNPPDLINLNPDFSALLAQKGALYEIDEKYSRKFKPEIVETLRYNGKLYSLPWYATSAVTVYNKDLLEKSGVKVPVTYKELAEISPIIKEKTGAYSFMPNLTENDTMVKILNKYNINTSNINSEKSAEIFDMFAALYEQNLIPKESITQTHREALEKYMAGQTVFFQAGTNFLTIIKENAPDTYAKTDIAPQITGSAGQNDFSLMNFVIPQNARRKNEAIKFLLFLTNENHQLELAELTNVLAVNNKALQNEFYTKYDKNDLTSKARVTSAQQLNKISPVFIAQRNQKEINTVINSAVQEILLNKNTTKKILDDVLRKLVRN